MTELRNDDAPVNDEEGELLFEIPIDTKLSPPMIAMRRAMRFNLAAAIGATLLLYLTLWSYAFSIGLTWWMVYLLAGTLLALMMLASTPFDYIGISKSGPGNHSFVSFLRLTLTWPAVVAIVAFQASKEFYTLDDRSFFMALLMESQLNEFDDMTQEEREELEG